MHTDQFSDDSSLSTLVRLPLQNHHKPMRRNVENLVTYSLLLFAMGTFTDLFLGDTLDRSDMAAAYGSGPVAFYVVELFLYGGCMLFAGLHYRRTLTALRAAWPFLLVVLMAFASSSWSTDAGTTTRRSGVLLGTTVFGIYLGGRYTIEEFQGILLKAFFLLLSLSLLAFALRPGLVVDPHYANAFKGLTEHKNPFGEYMGMLFLLGLTYQFKGRRGLARLATLIVAWIFLILDKSGAAVLFAISTVLILPVPLSMRYRKIISIPLSMAMVTLIIGVFMLGANASESVLSALGKDRTLTGRTDIWMYVWQAIGRRPLLGYGYDAFWHGMDGASLTVISQLGWNVPNSHDGYLEALLGLGAVGMSLFLLTVLRTGKDTIAYLRTNTSAAGLWPFAFLFMYLVQATSEASLIKRDGLGFLLFVTLSTSLALERQSLRREKGESVPTYSGWEPLETS